MLTREEIELIHQIAHRAVGLYERLNLLNPRDAKFAKFGIAYEIMTVHGEIVPLRLQEMLDADDGNFAHDISGIHRHLDPGKEHDKPRLRDCFIPRFAA